MYGDKTVITQFKGFINEAKIEVFVPFKKYRKGAIVTKNGYDTYMCLNSVLESSISNSRNWIKLRQTPSSEQVFSIKNK